MGLDEVLRVLGDEAAEPFFITFENLWQSSGHLTDWKRENITPPPDKKRDKEDTGSCRPVSLHCVPSRILGSVLRHRNSQHGFTEGKPCLMPDKFGGLL